MPDKTSKTPNKEELEHSKSQDGNESEEVLDGIPISPEVLDKLPQEMKSIFLAALSKQTTIGFPTNPLSNKITSEHIGKIIDSTEKDSEREFEFNKLELQDQKTSRWVFLAVFVIALTFVSFIIVFLSSVDKETMRFVLGLIVGLIGGFGIKELLPKSKKQSE